MYIFHTGSAACQGDSGGPLAQSSNGKIFLLGVVSYGPKDCRNNVDRRPDVYTDVRSFARWIRSETAYYDKSRWDANRDPTQYSSNKPASEDTFQQLVPQCGEDFCFLAEGGDCTFTRSIYTKCSDKISCDKDLIPSLDAFVVGAGKTFTANSVGAISYVRRPRRDKRRCTQWKYITRASRWRCQRFKRIARKRRALEGLDFKELVCPILSCKNRNIIPDEWSTPQHAEECAHLSNVSTSSSNPKIGHHLLFVLFLPYINEPAW